MPKSNESSKNNDRESELSLSDDVLDVGFVAFQLLTNINIHLDAISNLTSQRSQTDDHSSILSGYTNSQNQKVSDMCNEFIVNLTLPDPRKRLQISEALKHPWFLFK